MYPVQHMTDGFLEPVIDYTCNQGRAWKSHFNKIIYEVPDQVDSDPYQHPAGVINTYLYKSFSDVKLRMAAEVDLLLGNGMFQQSSTYQDLASAIQDKLYVTDIQTTLQYTKITFKEPEKIGLGAKAQSYVDQLNQTFELDPESYFGVIQKIGTHFFHVGIMGGVQRGIYKTNSSYYSKHSDYDIEAAAIEWYKNTTQNAPIPNFMNEDTAYFMNCSTEVIYNYGGDGANYFNYDEVQENSWVFQGSLLPISRLISKWDTAIEMDKAIEKYLGNRAYEQEMNK